MRLPVPCVSSRRPPGGRPLALAPRRVLVLLALVALVGVAAPAYGEALTSDTLESPRDLIERAHALAPTDLDGAINLARQAADVVTGSDSSAAPAEFAVRWYLTELLRFRLLLGWPDSGRLVVYRNQLARLDELWPAGSPRTILELLRAEIGLALYDVGDAVAHARTAARLASVDAEPGGSSTLAGPLQVTRQTVDLLLGIAMARQNPFTDGPLGLLANGVRGSIDPRFQNWTLEGQTQLILLHVAQGRADDAERLLNDVASVSHTPDPRASILTKMSVFAVPVGHGDWATKWVDEASILAHAEPNPLERGRLLALLVVPLLDLDAIPRALDTFAQAVDLLGSDPLGRTSLVQLVETGILSALEERELPEVGSRIYETLLSLSAISDDAATAVRLYATLARFYADLHQADQFGRVWQKAQEAQQAAPNVAAQQDLYLALGQILLTWDPERAADAYHIAVRLGMTSGSSDQALLFRGLRRAVALAMEIGRYQDAVDLVLIGRGLAFGSGPVDDVVEFLVDAGEAMTEVGRFDLGLDVFDVAGALARESSIEWSARISAGLGRLAGTAGDTQFGMVLLTRGSVRDPARSPNPAALRRFPDSLLLEGDLWARSGDLLRAEDSYQRCLEFVTRVVRRHVIEVRCHVALFGLHLARGDRDAALEEHRKAVEASLRLSTAPIHSAEKSALAWSLLQLTSSGRNLDQVESQIDGWVDALQKAPNTPPILAQRAAYEALKAQVVHSRGDTPPDLAAVRAALGNLFAEPYLSRREVPWIQFVATALATLGERDLAIATLSQLASRLEFAREALTTGRRLANVTLRVAFGNEIDVVFASMERLYLETPDGVVKALAVHEANRARAAGDLRRLAAMVDAAEPDAGDALDQRRRQLESAISGSRPDQILNKRRVSAAFALLNLITSPRTTVTPERNARASGTVPPFQYRALPTIAFPELQTRLEERTAIVVFRLGDQVPGAWVVSRQGMTWRPLTSLNVIERAIQRFRWALESPGDIDEERFRRIAAEAYEVLMRPLVADLQGKEKIVIIPDGLLFGVPLEALVIPDGPAAGRFVVEQYELSYQLSLELLLRSSHPHLDGRPHRLLEIGAPEWPGDAFSSVSGSSQHVPPLLAAREEMEGIRWIFGPDRVVLYEGDAARKDVLLGNLDEFTAVHLATHGVVKERDPWHSYLNFAGSDGVVTLWDLSKIRLSADLVVLSACETARGRVLAGEGAWGFVAQFLGSGAGNVVASLWRVDDYSTARLMQDFYLALAPEFSAYSTALRQAKLQLLRHEQWRHPYFWAPFVLYGGLP